MHASTAPAEPPSVSSRLQTKVLTSPAELIALGTEWGGLLQASRANSLFLTWEWISTWWDVYEPGQLHVVTVRTDAGDLVAVAPLYLVRREGLAFGGWQAAVFLGYGQDVTPEYLDFIVRRGWEDAAVPAILNQLMADPQIAELDLQPFAADSPVLATTLLMLRRSGGVTRHESSSRCPITVLPRSREEFLSSRSKNYRKKIGEYERRCERKLSSRVRRATTPDDVTRDLGTLRALHLARWGDESRAFRSTEYLDFHHRFAQLMLQQGRLRLFSLEATGLPLAVSYCFKYEDRYYFYQAGRNPAMKGERAGLVLMHKVLQEAIVDGAAVFDFLSGQEAYKYRWATAETGSDRVSHWKRTTGYASAMGHRTLKLLRSLPQRMFTGAGLRRGGIGIMAPPPLNGNT